MDRLALRQTILDVEADGVLDQPQRLLLRLPFRVAPLEGRTEGEGPSSSRSTTTVNS